MIDFLESIHVCNRSVRNAEWHLRRMERSVGHSLFADEPALLHLFERLQPHPLSDCVYKLRLVYNAGGVREATVSPYQKRAIDSLILVSMKGDVDYSFKYADRSVLQLFSSFCPHPNTEAILLRNGQVTDSTYSNLCFLSREDGEWYTPDQFLLNGTMRQSLLAMGQCKERFITLDTLHLYSHISLINAMMQLGELMVPMEKVLAPVMTVAYNPPEGA